jgi:hypothetical protein
MEWEPETVEAGIRECQFFRDHSFTFAGQCKVVREGTGVDAYEFRLENLDAQRAIEITFDPPRANGIPAVLQVYILNLASDDDFNLEEYLRQHHAVKFDRGFRSDEYIGTVPQRIEAFLDFATGLLAKHTKEILQGLRWPDVYFDWGGTR